ncbi:MAG: mechanosensitive ion channel, partial [Elusimicrobia bacterium]|nr:mechanosensitive ion channel [Elusimicrobiota bacterium]
AAQAVAAAAAPAARAEALPIKAAGTVAAVSAAASAQSREERAAPASAARDSLRWSAAFDGAAARPRSDDAVPAAPTAARRPALLHPAAAALAVPAGLKFLAPALPYAGGLGVLAGTWLAIRGMNRLLGAAAKWRGWDPATVVVARLGGEVALWAAGGSVALRVMGSDWTTVFASLGIGGLAVTLATKEFLGNLMRGIILMVDSPIRIGDRILVGDKAMRVVDMTFRSVVLEESPGEFTLMTYSSLASQAFTVLERTAADAPSAAQQPPSAPRRGAAFWAVSAAVLAGAAALGFWFPTAQPYLYASSILGATALLERLAMRGLRALADRRGWSATGSAVTRLGASLALYAAGVLGALAMAGVPWNVLLGGATVVGVALSVAASDIISNLLQAVWLLLSRPFRVGDRVAVGKAEGRVVDMTLRFVVLEAEPGADGAARQVFVPYSVVAAGPLRVFRDYPTRRRP